MSPEESRIVMFMYIGVAVFAVVAIGWAVVVRRRRTRTYLEGPGNPVNPASHEPWRRFTIALGGPYSRQEWHATRGARRKITPEQMYFGYAAAIPFPMIAKQLRKDWKATDSETAVGRVSEGVATVCSRAATLSHARGESAEAFRERLAERGAPAPETDDLLHWWQAHDGPLTDPDDAAAALAFDIARTAGLVRSSANVAYLDLVQADAYGDILGAAAVSGFDGWESYGRAYIVGLEAYTRRGTKPYKRAVEWLLSAQESPWAHQPWPPAERRT